jgi:hypothetical protein
MTDIVLLYNRANTFGLAKDVDGIKEALAGYTLRQVDPLEPPSRCDLAIHLEIPVYGWMPWASRNILVVNPEWFQEAWIPYMGCALISFFHLDITEISPRRTCAALAAESAQTQLVNYLEVVIFLP